MGRLQGSGASVKSLVKHHDLAQMSEADYVVRRCRFCEKRLDATVQRHDATYCNQTCRHSAHTKSRRAKNGPPRTTRWASATESARKANGAWVEVTCATAHEASVLQVNMQHKAGFDASRNDLVVSIRFIGVASHG